jgi:hypothetical protein
MDALLIGGIVAGVIVVIGVAAVFWWKRRQGSTINDALRTIAIERIDNILVPDGMGGEIHIEHLVLTARGILVIDVKPYEGIVFASDLMDSWTAIGAAGRTSFTNPLSSLYDRIAAVRQLIRGVEVEGFVLFPAKADFSKGRPDSVLLPDGLLESFARPDAEEIGRLRDAFAPQWEILSSAAQPASL